MIKDDYILKLPYDRSTLFKHFFKCFSSRKASRLFKLF